MKPSERRALREARIKASEEEAEVAATEAAKTPRTENEVPAPEADHVPYKRREGFFGAHIRLITFIITATLCLTVLGPLGIDMLVASKNSKGVTNLKDMEISTVYLIHDNAAIIEWKNFKSFNYSDYSYENDSGKYTVREYPIADSRLVLKVGGPNSKNHPEFIQLIDYKTGEYVNVLVDDPRDFVSKTEE